MDWTQQMAVMQHEEDVHRVIRRIRAASLCHNCGQLYDILREEGLSLSDFDEIDLRVFEREIERAK